MAIQDDDLVLVRECDGYGCDFILSSRESPFDVWECKKLRCRSFDSISLTCQFKSSLSLLQKIKP